MYRKRWRVMRSIEADSCKHERLTCADCGSFFFVQHRATKASLKEMRKLLKAIQAEEKERELNTVSPHQEGKRVEKS